MLEPNLAKRCDVLVTEGIDREVRAVGRYDGFEEFFAAQHLSLSRTALLLTGDRIAAEDLLQEALTRTAERWSRVVAEGDPTAYIRQIMLNDVRSAWRRRRRTSEHPVPAVADAAGAVDFTRRSDAGAALLAALRQLAPRQRAVLYLRFYEDRSEADTAKLLDCSVGTVKSQTHDALARLRTVAPELAPGWRGSEVNE